MKPSRRGFIRAAAGSLAAIGAGCTNQPRSATTTALKTPVVRKEVSGLEANDPDLNALKKAVEELKAMDQKQATSWLSQANIHGPMLGESGPCRHSTWFFLPWHRAYLHYFEEIVREVSRYRDFALPYWDWVKNPRMPAAFFDPPLNNPTRVGQPKSGRKATLTPDRTFSNSAFKTLIGPSVIEKMLNEPNFELFGGANPRHPDGGAGASIEAAPHNYIHKWVGGDMSTSGSPYDPIFWLHHCNVDRLWTEWMRRHPTGTPGDGTFLSERFDDFFDARGRPVVTTVADLLDTQRLGYRYEGIELFAAQQGKSWPVSAMQTISSDPIPLMDRSLTTFDFPNGSASMQICNSIQQTESARWQSVELRLNGIVIPKNSDVLLSVYVNSEKGADQVKPEDPGYVGSCTFFGKGRNHGSQSDATASFVFEAGQAFGRLYGNRRISAAEPLKVMVVSEPLFPDEENAGGGGVIDVSRSQVSIRVVSSP